jgi:hypothetical protein
MFEQKAQFLKNVESIDVIAKLPMAAIFEDIRYDPSNRQHGRAMAYVKTSNGNVFYVEVKRW